MKMRIMIMKMKMKLKIKMMKKWIKKKKDLNDNLEEIIDKSKSFEEQIKSLKKEKILKGIDLITILVIK